MGIEGKCDVCGFWPTYDYNCIRCTERERDAALLEKERLEKEIAGLKEVDIPAFQNQLAIANRTAETLRKSLELIYANHAPHDRAKPCWLCLEVKDALAEALRCQKS